MTVEQQLRSMAGAMHEAPITADEILSRSTSGDPARPIRSRMLLVVASVAILVGGLVAIFSLGNDTDEPPPVVSVPDSGLPTTTITDDQVEESASVNEPTLDYRDDASWWAPTALPAGWEYGYAAVLDGAQSIHLVEVADGSQIEVALDDDIAALDDQLAEGAITEVIGEQPWTVIEDDSATRIIREVDGRVLEVRGPSEPARLVAESLALVAETDLVRPPFRDGASTGPVVHTVAGTPFEVRAHTDGLYSTVGGDIKRVSSDDPLAFGDYQYEVVEGATSTQVLVSGVALAGLDRISFGLLDGDAADAESIASDRFAEDFFAVVIDVPSDVLGGYESGDIDLLTRWTIAEVDGQQRVYDEPASENCVNCGDVAGGTVDDFPEPAEPKRLTTPFVDGATNTYREGVTWWMPTEVPDGFEYLWAQEYGNGDRELYYANSATLADSEIIPTRADFDNISIYVTRGEPVEQWRGWLETGEREQVTVDGEIWLHNAPGGRALSRVVDDEFVSIGAATYDLAVEVVERLERHPETDFARPPYWFGAGEVVATLPPELGGGTPLELLAWTDGVTLDVDGQGPFFPTDEPIRFIGMTRRPPDQGGATTVAAVTSPGVATVEIEQLDGEVIVIEPTDLDGRYEIGFVFVAVGIPAGVQLDPDNSSPNIVSAIPSVVARDVDGAILAVISEPF